MQHGIIYPVVKYVVNGLRTFNLVELFKAIARSFNSDKANAVKVRAYERVGTDVFILAKWLFLYIAWLGNINSKWITVIIWYLIVTNVYTYFYYHVWCDDAITSVNISIERLRRRFVNLFLAFTFSNLSFAYLYYIPYVKSMSWGTGYTAKSLHAIWFSMSNSVAANYSLVAPADGVGNTIAMIQLVITFLFVTIIISRSIPQTQ